MAAPYTLMVPPAYPEALNMSRPEYAWAQWILVARLSVQIAFLKNHAANRHSMCLKSAAEQLDKFRRIDRLDIYATTQLLASELPSTSQC